MCKFTRTIHVCGHSLYKLHTSCPHAYISTLTYTHICPLIPNPTRALPNKFIQRTINRPSSTCGQDTCLYKAENDPFITPTRKSTLFRQQSPESTSTSSSPSSPGVPSFSTPKSLKVKGRSLFEELQPYSADMDFFDAVEADARITTPKLGSIVVGRGCVSATPKVVYHKYARLSTTPDHKLVRNSPPPEVVGPASFYGSDKKREKRKYEEYSEEDLVNKIGELAVQRRRRNTRYTPMDIGL